MEGVIYKFENLINGKCYVGQTVQPQQRIPQHWSNSKDIENTLPLYRAIRKHGRENFSVEYLIVLEHEDIDQLHETLDDLEMFYIQKYKAQVPTGYNLKSGGCFGGYGYKHTEETKKKLSANSLKHWKKGTFNNRPPISEEIEKNLVLQGKIESFQKSIKVKLAKLSKTENFLMNGKVKFLKIEKEN